MLSEGLLELRALFVGGPRSLTNIISHIRKVLTHSIQQLLWYDLDNHAICAYQKKAETKAEIVRPIDAN